MRAIIPAAGRGIRLQQPQEQQLPKCLLPFEGRTLLERHLLLLRPFGSSSGNGPGQLLGTHD